jgi:hypothetical protein
VQLYNIDLMLNQLFEEMDAWAEAHEGVVDKSYIELLNDLNMAKDEKILNIARYMKGLDAEAKAFTDEIKKLQARKQSFENKYDYLWNYICNHADKGKKIEDKTTVISWRKSESVQIVNDNDIPEGFIKVKVERSPDKLAIKEAIKLGSVVPGAELVENLNLQIK